MISRAKFYDVIRARLFDGKLTKDQVDGFEKILNFWDEWKPTGDVRHLCYMLATVYWETARTMQPIHERDNKSGSYLKGKKYYPYYGRGLVQLTWEQNYRLMQRILLEVYGISADLVANPHLAEGWNVALPVMFEGMFMGETGKGDFTGKSLEDYFGTKEFDPVNARRIINGTDRAKEIANIYNEFSNAMLASVSTGR